MTGLEFYRQKNFWKASKKIFYHLLGRDLSSHKVYSSMIFDIVTNDYLILQ